MSPTVISYLLLAASMSIIGLYVGLSGPLVSVLPILLIVWLRYLIAMPFLLRWFKRGIHEAPMSKQNMLLLALCTLIGSFLFTLCTLNGIKLTSALSAGIVMAALPAAVAILSIIFLKERVSLRMLFAIGYAIIGITLLAIANMQPLTHQDNTNTASYGQFILGHALLILGVFCEAAYVVIAKKLSVQVTPKRICAFMNLWGLVYSTPIGLYLFMQFDFKQLQWQSWSILVFYALAASVISVFLWIKGLKNIPASSAGIFTIMLPISTTFVGVCLGEHFGLMHAISLLLALLGIALATWPAHKTKDAQIEQAP